MKRWILSSLTALALAGCGAGLPPLPFDEMITQPAQCQEQGGCVLISRAHVIGLMRYAAEEAGQTCRRTAV